MKFSRKKRFFIRKNAHFLILVCIFAKNFVPLHRETAHFCIFHNHQSSLGIDLPLLASHLAAEGHIHNHFRVETSPILTA